MFMGEYRHNIDVKGRLTLPSKFRDEFENQVIVTKGFDGCLNIYTLQGWEAFYQKLAAIPTNKKQARTFIRLIASRATTCDFDKMGRINIPQNLRKEVGLDKAVVVIGNLDHIEIWDEAAWDAYYEEQSGHLEEISEEMDFEF